MGWNIIPPELHLLWISLIHVVFLSNTHVSEILDQILTTVVHKIDNSVILITLLIFTLLIFIDLHLVISESRTCVGSTAIPELRC